MSRTKQKPKPLTDDSPDSTPSSGSEKPPSAPKRAYVDIDALYSRALSGGDGQITVKAEEVRHLVEALLIVATQKREIGRLIAGAVQQAADEPLKGFDLDHVLLLVKQGTGKA